MKSSVNSSAALVSIFLVLLIFTAIAQATTPTFTSNEFSGLIFESRSKPSGSEVQIPLTMQGVKEKIGNMDLTLTYNSSVLEAKDVIKGGLTAASLFDYNIPSKGTIKISLADKEGFSGNGSVAQIVFNVIGANGSSSPLKIVSLDANKADFSEVKIPTMDGVFKVIGAEQCRGDCNGDGKITALDALCALQMSVGKKKEDLSMDVNADKKVSSLDAREILKTCVATTYFEEAMDIETFLIRESEFARLATSDSDQDGTANKYVLTFKSEEMAEDLFLDRKIEYIEKESGGYKGAISLHFENSGAPREYAHIEEIPKSFAEHVNDLKFSIPPDEIINPDPKISWRRNFIGEFEITITSDEVGTPALDSIKDCAATQGPVMCANIKDEKDRNDCYKEIAVIAGKQSICDKITDTQAAAICTGRIAVDKEDKTICEKIEDYDVKNKCVAAIALKTRSITLCEEISNPIQTRCIEKIAISEMNPAICENLKLESVSSNRDVCILIIAQEAGSDLLCEKIKDSSDRDECYNLVGIGKADPDICKKIVDPVSNKECNDAVAGIKGGKIADCLKITNGMYSEMCIEGIAVDFLDISLCYSIQDTPIRDSCLRKLAIARGELSDCYEITDITIRDKCIGAVAKEFLSLSDCDEIKDSRLRLICIAGIAVKLGDISLCEEIKDPEIRDKCIGGIAIENGDSALCNKISSPALRKACTDKLEGKNLIPLNTPAPTPTSTPASTPAAGGPSTVEFKDRYGKYTIRVTFPDGEGVGYEKFRIPDVEYELVRILINKRWPTQNLVLNAKIEVLEASNKLWAFVYRWDLRDPVNKIYLKDYDETKQIFNLTISSGTPSRDYGEFYFVQISDLAAGGSGFAAIVLSPKN